ncbi:MAG: metallophosphoesterase [Planctomycetaceae bacterium]|nr:metallophosphoesterase [Planctomycetaceae bacterium]
MKTRTIHSVTAALAAVLLASAVWAFPPAKPYDPRPLSEQAEKKLTADKFSFIVFGDTKNSKFFPGVVKLADSLAPTFALTTGDMVKSGHTSLYDDLERTAGPFMRKYPTWPCVGNHELATAEGWGMYKAFHGITAWDYSFDFRNARFIQIGAPNVWEKSAKMKWLEEQLAEGKKAGKHLFIWQHQPIYSVGQKRPREVPGQPNDFTRLCDKYGVIAVFAGHEHNYYRTFRDGVSYITQALAGAQIYYLNRRSEAVDGDVYYGARGKELGGTLLVKAGVEKVYPTGQYMVTQVFIDGDKVTGKTVAVGGEVIDEFTLLPRPTTRPSTRAATQQK